MTSNKAYSLFTILNRVKSILHHHTFNKCFWVKTQISKVNSDRFGNYYLELIESENGNVIAKCDATIWADNFKDIALNLKDATKDILKNGSEILCLATLDYSEKYGLKLNILEIDLTYNLGEIEKRKQQNLIYLKNQNLINLNKQKKLPLVVQKIALIGSPATAGFTDFIKQLEHNNWGFKFSIQVFESLVQGEKASAEIINALNSINHNLFDAIAIVRGGGSKFDLEIFNDLNLAITISNSKIPVLTGIGHETDISIADMVSYQYFKTPTALAAHIIEMSTNYLHKVTTNYLEIVKEVKTKLKQNQYNISIITEQIKSKSIWFTQQKISDLDNLSNKIGRISSQIIHQNKLNLKAKSEQISYNCNVNFKEQNNLVNDYITFINIFKNQIVNENKQLLIQKTKLIDHFASFKINSEKNKLGQLAQIPNLYSPQNILNLGYAIVRKNNLVLKDSENLKSGDEIEIELSNKKLNITIENISEKIKWKDILTKELQQN